MIEEIRRKVINFAVESKFQSELKNTSLNYNVDSMKSIPEDKNTSNSKSNLVTTTTLPINLFHSPGEYNKMIIRCSNPHKESYLEKKMGIVRTLEFINQPFFQKEKQKRIERLKKYQEELAKQRQELNNKQTQQKLNCQCCCCDKYCEDCAKITCCEMPQDKSQRNRQQFQKDIEIIKKRLVQKQKKREISQSMQKDSSESQDRVKKPKKHNFHIDMLVNETLFKQIQAKREKMLEKLSKQERDKANHQYNQTVRKINKQRAQSAQPRRSVQKGPTKQEIREAYWNQIKDLVAQQIKKDKTQQSKLIQSLSQNKQVKKKEKTPAQQIAINRFIAKKSKQTLKQMKQEKEKNKSVQKMKAKRLLALAAEQAEIIKKNKPKKFKASQEMLQNAFKLFD